MPNCPNKMTIEQLISLALIKKTIPIKPDLAFIIYLREYGIANKN